MTHIAPIAPKILACRTLPRADRALCASFGVDADATPCLALVTCDQDDSMYVALDHATKFADVEVRFARSFYAGSAHASGPLSGEILGILAASDPASLEEGLSALRRGLEEDICFYEPVGGGPAFFPQVIGETGRYLSSEAKIPVGAPMAYLIAPPLESVIGLDAALKAADVRLLRHFPPPTETNFGGGWLGGELAALEAAARAFTDAVLDCAAHPHEGLRRPSYERR